MSEPQKRKRRRVVLLVLLTLLMVGGVVGWFQRNALQSSYYGYRLENAAETERQKWADRLVELGEPAIPKLLSCFRKDDRVLCMIARDSLEKLMAQWGPTDPRCGVLADRFFEDHANFSSIGQIAALHLLPSILKTGVAEVNARARTIVSAGLNDKSFEVRLAAVLTARGSDLNLLSAVVPLLDDPEPRVRCAALLAAGPINDISPEHPVISSEDLLKWLHDSDPEVRRICEEVLKEHRKLQDKDIRLGRMLKNPNPTARLNLLLDLPEEENLDLRIWLQRLSNDADSAVRAGAARVAAEHRVDFAERLEEMSREDPDETVRKIAAHYGRRYRNQQ